MRTLSPRRYRIASRDRARRRAADRRPHEVLGKEPKCGRHAGHRRGDGRDRRDGARRQGQQGARRAHRPQGGRAVGLSGKDGDPGSAPASGCTGCRPARWWTSAWSARSAPVDVEPLRLLEESGFVPVIAPVGVGERGETLQHQRRPRRRRHGRRLGAEKLVHLTDVQGIMGDRRPARQHAVPEGSRAPDTRRRDRRRDAAEGRVLSRALEAGTAKAHIIDGRLPARGPARAVHARRRRHRTRL